MLRDEVAGKKCRGERGGAGLVNHAKVLCPGPCIGRR
jgi:hypothetical protein